MSNNLPTGKICLPSTSKISLHERFTKLSNALAVSNIEKIKRVGPAAPLRSSEKNRKLALQMASRPSVQAALRIKNKTIRQRVGAVNPLSYRQTKQTRPQLSGLAPARNLKQRLGPVAVANRLSVTNSLAGRIKILGNKSQQARVLNTGNFNARGKIFRNQRQNQANNLYVINRVNNNVGFKKRNKFQLKNNLRGRLQAFVGQKKNFRKKLNSNGKPNIVNAKNNTIKPDQKTVKSKEILDSDLDSYMAKTKTHLDNDIDAYMTQTQ